MLGRAGPILKSRIEKTLGRRFNSRVQLETLRVSAISGFEVKGEHLRITPEGAAEPIIYIESFSFHASLFGLFFKPTRVDKVYVTGLEIRIPPREERLHFPGNRSQANDKNQINVQEIVCNDSRLTIAVTDPKKDPKIFVLRHIELHDVGPDAPWRYEASLTNAIPRGEIHATGTFGPWRTGNPGDSSVSGHYTFEHADLRTIKGIGGMLSSVGDFTGRLDRIAIEGTADVPGFSLSTANRSMPLHTTFHATVDGTTGDTYLERVDAKLRNSSFTTSGTIVNLRGQGHRIDLDTDIPAGHLQDFLDLAVKTRPAVITAIIAMRAKLQIDPGSEPVPTKIRMASGFSLTGVRFTNAATQDTIDQLSMRAQGDPENAKPGAKFVASTLRGTFDMNAGSLHFSNLAFAFPGAHIRMAGIYTLDGKTFDFKGKLQTDAKLSQMVAAKWKSRLLKVADFLFYRQGGGSQIPFTVSGTTSAPKFGVDILGRHFGIR